jgi:hypothetical protein
MDSSTTSFRDLPWTERRKRLGDEAEETYERDRNNRGVRWSEYGLGRPDFTGREMAELPASIRHEPDFIESWDGHLRFVEVQGVGNDWKVRLKDEKIAVLVGEDRLPVWMFLWCSPAKRFVVVPIGYLGPLIIQARLDGQRDVYDAERRNPKPYTWLHWDTLTANAVVHRVAPSARAAQMGTRVDRGTA